MSYTVLSVAYPLTPVGPDAVGGSEQILSLLDQAITRAGHRSIVIAAEGSSVAGLHVPSASCTGPLDEETRARGRAEHALLIRQTLARFSVDVVHMHSLDFHAYIPDPPVPVLATLHLPPDWYPSRVYRLRRSSFYLNCVSSSQQRTCPSSRHLIPPIPNGIRVESFSRQAKQDYVLSLGRICPEKGFHIALDAAKRARVEMTLAGEVFPYAAHLRYFKRQIVPRLSDKRKFVGPVGLSRKRRLLAQARCLLVPSQVAETSSLVAMEALAAGTPVIAFPSGALPEIIEHGRTGFLVSSAAEMADAIRSADELSPEACRNAAKTRFTADQMVQNYFHQYARIIGEAKTREESRVRPGASWLFAWQ